MAISPLLPVLSLFVSSFLLLFLDCLFFHGWGGGGGQGLVFNPGAFTNYFGPREVFIIRAFFNPIWTLPYVFLSFGPKHWRPIKTRNGHPLGSSPFGSFWSGRFHCCQPQARPSPWRVDSFCWCSRWPELWNAMGKPTSPKTRSCGRKWQPSPELSIWVAGQSFFGGRFRSVSFGNRGTPFGTQTHLLESREGLGALELGPGP